VTGETIDLAVVDSAAAALAAAWERQPVDVAAQRSGRIERKQVRLRQELSDRRTARVKFAVGPFELAVEQIQLNWDGLPPHTQMRS
jgi:hypothetical protein